MLTAAEIFLEGMGRDLTSAQRRALEMLAEARLLLLR
jgi:hypothetical protein